MIEKTFVNFCATVLFIELIVNGEQNIFGPIAEECNEVFPLKTELISARDFENFTTLLKDDRNGKCFIHCVFHKVNLVDGKGNIKKSGIFENFGKLWDQMSGDKKESSTIQQITAKMRITIISFIEYCEAQESVAKETDPCDKFYNFKLCYRDSDQLKDFYSKASQQLRS